MAEQGLPRADAPGAADKAIALKRCHNVTVRDIAILAAGHFGILATGVDNLTLEDLKIDTNRDGINVDCCRNVRISKCSVNSPWDDGICLKSSFALGEARATENVTISDCYLTGGFALGAMLDGTFRRTEANAGQPTGRIKCGTESNGGFRNITITNCVFETCRGFALETVDGGPIEDITFAGVTMRDIRNAPFFLRLGARLRGPAGTSVGTFKRVRISNIMCEAPANDMPAIIAGIPAHPIEDVSTATSSWCRREEPQPPWPISILRSRSGNILSQALLARCPPADCWCVTPRTSSSTISKSIVFKRTRDHSCGSAMLMARTFPDSACRRWMRCRRCVYARSATYVSQGAEGFRIHCLITSRTVGFLRRRRIGLGPEEPRNRRALAIIVYEPARSYASYEC